MKTDKEFLTWIHDRLVNVHGESPHADYMHRLRLAVASAQDDRLVTNRTSEWWGMKEWLERWMPR